MKRNPALVCGFEKLALQRNLWVGFLGHGSGVRWRWGGITLNRKEKAVSAMPCKVSSICRQTRIRNAVRLLHSGNREKRAEPRLSKAPGDGFLPTNSAEEADFGFDAPAIVSES